MSIKKTLFPFVLVGSLLALIYRVLARPTPIAAPMTRSLLLTRSLLMRRSTLTSKGKCAA